MCGQQELVAQGQGKYQAWTIRGVHSAWGTLGDSVHTPTLLLNLRALPPRKGSPSPLEKRKCEFLAALLSGQVHHSHAADDEIHLWN